MKKTEWASLHHPKNTAQILKNSILKCKSEKTGEKKLAEIFLRNRVTKNRRTFLRFFVGWISGVGRRV